MRNNSSVFPNTFTAHLKLTKNPVLQIAVTLSFSRYGANDNIIYMETGALLN